MTIEEIDAAQILGILCQVNRKDCKNSLFKVKSLTRFYDKYAKRWGYSATMQHYIQGEREGSWSINVDIENVFTTFAGMKLIEQKLKKIKSSF